MSARLNESGERVWEGDQVEVSYHYEPLSKAFRPPEFRDYKAALDPQPC